MHEVWASLLELYRSHEDFHPRCTSRSCWSRKSLLLMVRGASLAIKKSLVLPGLDLVLLQLALCLFPVL